MHATMWLNLENNMSREISQTQKDRYCVISRILESVNSEGQSVIGGYQGLDGGVSGVYYSVGTEFLLGVTRKFWK